MLDELYTSSSTCPGNVAFPSASTSRCDLLTSAIASNVPLRSRSNWLNRNSTVSRLRRRSGSALRKNLENCARLSWSGIESHASRMSSRSSRCCISITRKRLTLDTSASA
eukprot:239698-Chlamydomonas_euryale.AAC.8